jgi:hypothetical protein
MEVESGQRGVEQPPGPVDEPSQEHQLLDEDEQRLEGHAEDEA